jgi:hypothetical protein
MDHLSDEEDDYDDPDEPMMEGSNDEFSDLEMDERDDDYDPADFVTRSSPAATPGTSTLSRAQSCSPTLGGYHLALPALLGLPHTLPVVREVLQAHPVSHCICNFGGGGAFRLTPERQTHNIIMSKQQYNYQSSPQCGRALQ